MGTVRNSIYAVAILLAAAGCERQSGTVFVLPEGNVELGRELFLSYGCNGCHTIPNEDLPEPDIDGPVRVSLGGRVSKVKTYPELVTSIINPSHRFAARQRAEEVSADGESLMTVYNDVMTVSELIHIVAFLESSYEQLERPGYRYPTYTLSE